MYQEENEGDIFMVDQKHDVSEETEQGFNDSELEDIMSEIEALENEFASGLDEEDDDAKGAEVVRIEAVESSRASKKPAMKSKPAAPKFVSNEADPVSMEFKVAGQMDMNLKFCIGGEWVHVKASASDGLVVEVEGGAKFCLPLKRAS